MRQGAAGQTQTRVGRSQLYGMWSPAQRTDLNLASYEVTFHPNPLTQSFDRFCTGGITAVNSNTVTILIQLEYFPIKCLIEEKTIVHTG